MREGSVEESRVSVPGGNTLNKKGLAGLEHGIRGIKKKQLGLGSELMAVGTGVVLLKPLVCQFYLSWSIWTPVLNVLP